MGGRLLDEKQRWENETLGPVLERFPERRAGEYVQQIDEMGERWR
jgi:hypothetical protein